MSLIWMNMTKQKFMNWAAGIIILAYEINSICINIFLSGNIKQITPIVYERMLNVFVAQQTQIVTSVILYFFARQSFQDTATINTKKDDGI